MMGGKKKGAFGKPNMFARKADQASPAESASASPPKDPSKPIWMQQDAQRVEEAPAAKEQDSKPVWMRDEPKRSSPPKQENKPIWMQN